MPMQTAEHELVPYSALRSLPARRLLVLAPHPDDEVLGCGLPRVGVEAGVTRGWGAYGCVATLGIDRFGESAPGATLFEEFGFTAPRLAQQVQQVCRETVESEA